MGTSRDFAELAGKFSRLPGELDKGMYYGVKDAATAATRSIRAEAAADTHGTMRLRGVGKNGRKISVGYKKISTRIPHNPTAYVVARGPWALIEYDTPEHDIPKTGKRLRRKRKTLKFQAGGETVYAKTVHHPGTTGKGTFHRGARKATPVAMAAYDRALKRAMGRVFT